MDQKQVARICSLESFAAKNPGIYRARVALLASLGYVPNQTERNYSANKRRACLS